MNKSAKILYTIAISLIVSLSLAELLCDYFHFSNKFLSIFIRQMFSNVCHQNSQRCFIIYKHTLPICARCSGIYLALFISTLFLWTKRKYNFKGYFLSSVLLIPADIIFYNIGLYRYSTIVAFITGFVSTLLVMFYIFTKNRRNYEK